MPIRSKEERRALHTTPQKKVRSDTPTKQGNTSKITRSGGKIFEESSIDGQKLYTELNTSAKPLEAAAAASVGDITIVGGSSATVATAASHNGLSNVTSDQHHNQQHGIDSGSDHTGILSVGKGGTALDTVAADRLLTGNGTSALTAEANLVYTSTGLGVGFAAPATLFHSQSSSNSQLRHEVTGEDGRPFFQSKNDQQTWSFGADGATSDAFIWSNDAGSNIEMCLTPAGKVGIGTVAPDYLLEIQGGIGTDFTCAGTLGLSTKETTIIAGDVLGLISFYAPLENTGGTTGDQRLPAAAIWCEARTAFSNTSNLLYSYFVYLVYNALIF